MILRTRRDFLQTTLASSAAGSLLLAAGLPGASALAASPPASNRKFIFVFAYGGWDTTRVFAPEFTNNNVDLEPDSDKATAGNITYVDHASRPSVRTFMERNHERTVIFNGVMVRSIAHEICQMIAMTGFTSGLGPDWATHIAHARRDAFTLPHMVLGGLAFTGDLGVAVARTGGAGQLEALLSGEILDYSDVRVPGISSPMQSLVDRYVSRRSGAAAQAAAQRSAIEEALYADFEMSLERSTALKDLQYVMDFTGGNTMGSQGLVAVEALRLGISRCVTLAHPVVGGSWDTHADNDALQAPLWEDLFSGLGQILEALQQTPGEVEPTLADETTLVVMSELGRTPLLNDLQGKDHWPYTSAMIVGPGLVGDRVIGGFDEVFYGERVDAATGDVSDQGQVLSAEAVGATILALGDVDPYSILSGVDPIEGVIA